MTLRIGAPIKLQCSACPNGCDTWDGQSGWHIGAIDSRQMGVRLEKGAVLVCRNAGCHLMSGVPRLFPPSPALSADQVESQYLGLTASVEGSAKHSLHVVGVACATNNSRFMLVRFEGNSDPAPALSASGITWHVGYWPTQPAPGHTWIADEDCELTSIHVDSKAVESATSEEDDTVRCARELRIRLGYTGPASSPKRMEDQSWAVGWSGRLF